MTTKLSMVFTKANPDDATIIPANISISDVYGNITGITGTIDKTIDWDGVQEVYEWTCTDNGSSGTDLDGTSVFYKATGTSDIKDSAGANANLTTKYFGKTNLAPDFTINKTTSNISTLLAGTTYYLKSDGTITTSWTGGSELISDISAGDATEDTLQAVVFSIDVSGILSTDKFDVLQIVRYSAGDVVYNGKPSTIGTIGTLKFRIKAGTPISIGSINFNITAKDDHPVPVSTTKLAKINLGL